MNRELLQAIWHRDGAFVGVEVVVKIKEVAHNANRVQHGTAGRHEENVRNFVAVPLAGCVWDPDVRIAHSQDWLNSCRREYREPRVVVRHAQYIRAC